MPIDIDLIQIRESLQYAEENLTNFLTDNAEKQQYEQAMEEDVDQIESAINHVRDVLRVLPGETKAKKTADVWLDPQDVPF